VGDTAKRDARRYHSPRRAEQAAQTRRAVLAAARDLFVGQGYAATTVAEIAREARVAVDTVYATVGRKPALLREVLETAISGGDAAVPADERDYVARVRAAASAHDKITAYVTGLVDVQRRLAPVYLALHDAAGADTESAALWKTIAERRAQNMRRFAADLRATGELRADLTDDDVADIVWSMNGTEYWVLLVGNRGWSAERFAAYLIDAWSRLLLA
jgi:AcrR family transcriptional regulator